VRQPIVIGADGGNSKTDLWIMSADGTLVGTAIGGTASHQQIGLERGIAMLERLAIQAARSGADPTLVDRRPLAEVGVFCLAGADFPSDVRALQTALGALGLTGSTTVLNDAFAGLRAGARRPWGVGLVCGEGVNGAAIGPDGRRARFDGVGDISGDWGGGPSVGEAALAAAVRGRDGRGPRTALERLVPRHFGVARPGVLVRMLYEDRRSRRRLRELSPLTFEVAEAGDAVARGIVDRLADELATMGGALIRRLRMTRLDVEVVLTGGVFRATDPAFYARLEQGIRRVAPDARIVRLSVPPVVGAVLLGLDQLELPKERAAKAEARVRQQAAAQAVDAGL